MRPKLDDNRIKYLYLEAHLTLREIASILSVSHTCIAKHLKSLGISSTDGELCSIICSFCGKPIIKHRSRIRKNLKNYCSTTCYYAAIENPNYIMSRQGQRLARAIVNQHFGLRAEYVVHHKDGDTTHNDLSNLAVFASHADHMAYTRGRTSVTPIWDGLKHQDKPVTRKESIKDDNQENQPSAKDPTLVTRATVQS